MKKRIVAFLLLLAMTVTLLAGCDVITKNEQRDYEQAVATVEYRGLKDTVTKMDVITAFNSYGYYYVYYYSYTYEDTFDLLLKSLAQQKLLTLYARAYHAEEKGLALESSLDKLLTANEVAHAINLVNDDMEEALHSIIDELEEEAAAANPEEEEEAAEPIKLVQTEEVTYAIGDEFDTDKYQLELTDEAGEVTTVALTADMLPATLPDMTTSGNKTFTVTYEEKQYSYDFYVSGQAPRTARAEEAEAEWDAAAVYTGDLPVKLLDNDFNYNAAYVFEHEMTSEFFAQAKKNLVSNIKSNYKTYDDYLNDQMEALLLESLQRKLQAGALTADRLQSELASYASIRIDANKEAYAKSATAYSTALTTDVTNIAYHEKTGYGFVYNILLQFSDEQTATLKKYGYDTTSGKGGIYYTTDEVYKQVRATLADQITVDISNLEYDPEYKCDEHTCDAATDEDDATVCYGDCDKHSCGKGDCPANAYVAYDVPVAEVLAWIKADLDNAAAITNAYERQMAIIEVAAQWVYRVNDDPGMYAAADKATYNGITNNGLGYLITPEGETSSYVEEFTALGRELVKKGAGSYTAMIDGVDTFYCVTDFGIHIMVVSYIPYDFAAFGIDGNALFASSEAYDAKTTPDGYIVKYGNVVDAHGTFSYDEDAAGKYVFVGGNYVLYDAADTAHAELTRYTLNYTNANCFDAEGKLKVSEVNPTLTYGEVVDTTVRANVKSDVYSETTKEFAGKYDEYVTVKDKLLKKIIEDLESAS